MWYSWGYVPILGEVSHVHWGSNELCVTLKARGKVGDRALAKYHFHLRVRNFTDHVIDLHNKPFVSHW